MKIIYSISLLAIFLTACQTQQKTTTGSSDSSNLSSDIVSPPAAGGTMLLSGRWNIVAIDKLPVLNAAPFIEFKNDTAMAGKNGCNSFGGQYLLKGYKIYFDKVFSTKMACDADKMKTESQLMNHFNGNELLIEKNGAGELQLKNEAGEEVILLRRE